MYRTRSQQHGFTLIEMIVALGVFSIVITIAVGALLMLVNTNQQLQKEQAVMTNLSFALDSMTREIRTGTRYYCESHPTTSGPGTLFSDASNLDSYDFDDGIKDCDRGNQSSHRYHGVAFIEGGNSISASNERILYFHDRQEGRILRKVGTEVESITASDIFIKDVQFVVTGSASVRDGVINPSYFTHSRDQPSVTVYIEATEASDTTQSYFVQTTVTQRTLDI